MSQPPLPEGFAPLDLASAFVRMAGPFLGRRSEGRVDIGFRVEERHCNPWRNCHGGWLSTLADVQLAIGCKARIEVDYPDIVAPRLATISMALDFLAPAPCGAWVEGNAQVLRVSRRTVVAQMTATADGVVCLRANGSFTI
jgi:uncharacterized protein (TIGR00369 family)